MPNGRMNLRSDKRLLRSDVSSGKRRFLRCEITTEERKKRKTDKRGPVLDERSGERIEGVWTTRTAEKYTSMILDPIKKTYIWLGTFDTVQEASEAYNAKKRELEFQTDQTEPESSRDLRKEMVSMKSDKYNGGGAIGFMIPVSGQARKVFVPVIDNHGYLIGKFSQGDVSVLDDWLSTL